VAVISESPSHWQDVFSEQVSPATSQSTSLALLCRRRANEEPIPGAVFEGTTSIRVIAARAGTVRRLGIAKARELQLERERPRSREWCTRTSCPRRQRDLADGLGLTSGVVLGVLRVVERQRREPRGLGGGCGVGTSRGGCGGLDGGPVSDSGGQLSLRAGAARVRRVVLAAHLFRVRGAAQAV